jgi:hypothetical protein
MKMGEAASDLDGEQMRAPGEGDVYRQQFKKTGFGEQEDLVSDLDKKKAEQAGARKEMKEARVSGTRGQAEPDDSLGSV